MGCTTQFKGRLSFVTEPTVKQLAMLKSMFGEDCRNHPEWDAKGLYYIDLELTEDFSGIRWDGSEKTYDLDKLVNVVLAEMQKQWPEFGLTGALIAQGEEIEDRWSLTIGNDGKAHKIPLVVTGRIVTCPNCDERFEINT